MTARRAAQARAPVLSVGDVLDLPFAGACAPRDPTARRLSTPHRLNGHRNGERPRLSAGVTDPGVLLSLVATGRGHLAAPATSGRFYVHPAIAWVPVPSATPFSEGVVVPERLTEHHHSLREVLAAVVRRHGPIAGARIHPAMPGAA